MEVIVGDVIGFERFACTRHGRGDAGETRWADAVHSGADGSEFLRKSESETSDCSLRRCVVGLTKIATKTCARCGVDDSTSARGARLRLITEVLGRKMAQ